eukprot:g2248.t1
MVFVNLQTGTSMEIEDTWFKDCFSRSDATPKKALIEAAGTATITMKAVRVTGMRNGVFVKTTLAATLSIANLGAKWSIFGKTPEGTLVPNAMGEIDFATGTLSVTKSKFYGNFTARAITAAAKATTGNAIVDSVFENYMGGNGGAVSTDAPLSVSRTTFKGNKASQGAGIYSTKNVSLFDCVFDGNNAVNGSAWIVDAASYAFAVNPVFVGSQSVVGTAPSCTPAVCDGTGFTQCTKNAGVLTCSVCETGKFQQTSSTGVKSCEACPAGSVSDTVGAVDSCTACASGSYQALTGQTSCTQCAAGKSAKANAAAGQTSENDACASCASGKYRTTSDNVANCVSCQLGKAGTGTGKVSEGQGCTNCITGTYGSGSVGNAAVACSNCSVGSFGSGAIGNETTACNACPAGKRAKANAAAGQATEDSACSNCAAGKYRPASAAVSACVDCAVAKFGNVTGSSNETLACAGNCALGKAGTGTGKITESESCTNCASGQFGSGVAGLLSVACKACPAGKFGSGTLGAETDACTACPAGKATKASTVPSTEDLGCGACDAGKYRSATDDVSTCVACASGKVATKEVGQSEEAKACADKPDDDTLSSGYIPSVSCFMAALPLICMFL